MFQQEVLTDCWKLCYGHLTAYVLPARWSTSPLWARDATLSGRDISILMDCESRSYSLATTFADLSCVDFFLWRMLNCLIYATPLKSKEEHVVRHSTAAAEVRDIPGVFHNFQKSLLRRSSVCITVECHSFEQFFWLFLIKFDCVTFMSFLRLFAFSPSFDI